jgi:RecA-family ATPase
LFGPPDSLKTFVALHLALCIATGHDCFGRKVRQGSIVYITGEGEEGFRQRVEAWSEAHPLAPPLDRNRAIFLPEAVNLLDEKAVDALIEQLGEIEPAKPSLVVIDTLARCMVGGDENSSRDVGLAVHAADRLKRALGCTVLLIHHTAKKMKTERGSGALRGAADTMLRVAKSPEGLKLHCEKQKNSAAFKPIQLSITEIELGEILSSLVVAYDPAGDLTDAQRRTLQAVGKAGATFDEMLDDGVPRTSLRRALRELVSAGLVKRPLAHKGGRYRLKGIALSILERVKGKKVPETDPEADE